MSAPTSSCSAPPAAPIEAVPRSAAAHSPLNVGLGQISVARGTKRLTSVLGSCVGIVVYCPRQGVGGMAHVVLPDSSGRDGLPGKYADTAVPALVRALREAGGSATGAVVKLVGGASMFGKGGPLQVGDANLAAVRKALAAAGLEAAGEHVGGKQGRRVSLDCATGKVFLEIVGNPAVEI